MNPEPRGAKKDPMPQHDTRTVEQDFEYVLVGGGLQNALLVLALRELQPGARIALVERDVRLGGNHTWCFHAGDVSAAFRAWLQPLISADWDGYEVRFPDSTRLIQDRYAAILSDRLHAVVADQLAGSDHALITGISATSIEADGVVLEDGRRLRGRLVVDARGPAAVEGEDAPAGYQKFLGQELRLAEPHAFERPVLMDATVEQQDGFRFFYVLPLAPDRILVEDTRFSGHAGLDADGLRSEIAAWVRGRGMRAVGVEREERGVLPMPWSGRTDVPGAGVLRAGYRGGWFHPGTGYSLPVAARLAEAVARVAPSDVRAGALRGLHREHERQRAYCHLLNRLLFRWYPPSMRWHVFARFYRLPGEVIARFYALALTPTDQARLLVGRPPRGLSVRYRMRAGASS